MPASANTQEKMMAGNIVQKELVITVDGEELHFLNFFLCFQAKNCQQKVSSQHGMKGLMSQHNGVHCYTHVMSQYSSLLCGTQKRNNNNNNRELLKLFLSFLKDVEFDAIFTACEACKEIPVETCQYWLLLVLLCSSCLSQQSALITGLICNRFFNVSQLSTCSVSYCRSPK